MIAAALAVLTFTLYQPTLEYPFLRFDDPEYVTANPNVWRGLSGESVRWAFTTFHQSNWHPLTWLTHMLDCELFGDWAGGHRLVNILLHAANTILLFLLLRQMTGALWRSAFVAMLFAVHPLRLESVVWVAERKDVLSAFFFLLTLWAYVGYAKKLTSEQPAPRQQDGWPLPRGKVDKEKNEGPVRAPFLLFSAAPFRRFYALAFLFFTAGLMSKPMVVTLPFVMLFLDWWPLNRFGSAASPLAWSTVRPLLAEKLPFFALAAASCVVTFVAQRSGGSVVDLALVPPDVRIANAAIAYVAYLRKAVWPSDLAVFYPFPPDAPVLLAAAAVLWLAVVSAVVWHFARRAPFLFTGWFWYLGTLVPVIGLVQVGSQAMADRYTYLPLVGVLIAAMWGAERFVAGHRGRAGVAVVLGVGAIAACAAANRFHQRFWSSTVALFERSLQVAPRFNVLGRHNLGQTLFVEGRREEGLEHLTEAARLAPDFVPARFSLATTLDLMGRHAEALREFRAVIRLKPDRAHYQVCMAGTLVALKRFDEARAALEKALALDPDHAEARTKLGNLLLLLGREDEALAQLERAVQLRPTYADGQYYLGAALARQKRLADAVRAFEAALRAEPNHVMALNDLAWIRATADAPELRNPAEAVRLARRACELTDYENAFYLDTLGVAHSEAGRMEAAAAVTARAAALAQAAGDALAAAELQWRARCYQSGLSYRNIPRADSPATPRSQSP
ncbi:MAG: tetratricopeptide repeat protein [Verrucomicrobiales bacterium]|nr:tetratricopeptide repeat protein [Verrucomicrobiales bacterium]